MYICNNCGNTKDELRLCRQGSEFGNQTVYEEYYDDSCSCGGYFDEAEECACCGEYMSGDNYIICEACLEKEAMYENAKEYGDENKEEVEINGFYANAFSADKIEEILDRELKNSSSAKEAAKRYCHEDTGCFADFLEKQYKKFEEER